MNKKIKITALALTLVALASAYGVNQVGAAYGGNNDTLINRFAERFGVSTDEVKAVFEENRAQMQVERKAEVNTQLDKAVTDGKITEAQKALIVAHHDEMQVKKEGFKDLDPEARREAMQSVRQENKDWAEANGIDMKELGIGKQGGQFRGGKSH